MPRILEIWAHVDPAYGGVGPAAAQLAAEVACTPGWDAQFAAICSADETRLADGIPHTVNKILAPNSRFLAGRVIRRPLRRAIASCDVCHVHGLWLPHTLVARSFACSSHKPLISSVHGMLEKWELANKALKKRIYSNLFERSSLRRSDCLRALSRHEAEDYRRYGIAKPIAVVPNGVPPLNRIDPALLFSTYPHLAGKSIILFLSRIHYKKGILNLLEAWASVAREVQGAHLLVAGPDYEQTRGKAEALVHRYGLNASVTFCGTLSGEMKMAALSAARFFCLPSYSEGLSVATLEALSIGVPVVLTDACNMDDIVSHGAGLISPNIPSELAANLVTCLHLDDPTWARMSRSASQLARERYSWSRIAETMRSVYSWTLGGPKPACVLDA